MENNVYTQIGIVLLIGDPAADCDRGRVGEPEGDRDRRVRRDDCGDVLEFGGGADVVLCGADFGGEGAGNDLITGYRSHAIFRIPEGY